jgi:hypothetical protein
LMMLAMAVIALQVRASACGQTVVDARETRASR